MYGASGWEFARRVASAVEPARVFASVSGLADNAKMMRLRYMRLSLTSYLDTAVFKSRFYPAGLLLYLSESTNEGLSLSRELTWRCCRS